MIPVALSSSYACCEEIPFQSSTYFICKDWRLCRVPHQSNDAIRIVAKYKNEGYCADCGNSRDI